MIILGARVGHETMFWFAGRDRKCVVTSVLGEMMVTFAEAVHEALLLRNDLCTGHRRNIPVRTLAENPSLFTVIIRLAMTTGTGL